MAESPRRRHLLEAAVQVITDEGLRGLTHRAVDRRAGLPEGSCSAYLRTRSALQQALAEYVAQTLLADVDALAERLRDAEHLDEEGIDAMVDLFSRWLDQRELLVARLELTMAATRDPDLYRVLAVHRTRLVEVAGSVLVAPDKDRTDARAEALVASYDGVLLAALLKPANRRRGFLRRSLELLSTSVAADGPV